MKRIISRRPRPATIISLVALFIALGGTSYAAISLVPNNSVGSPQVINGSLQKVDLSSAAVRALRGRRGLRGAAGAVGATGPPGPLVTLEAVHRVGLPGEPAFGTNWSNIGSNFEPAGFYREPWGIVHLVGDFASAASRGLTMFTLPLAYRPASFERFAVYGNGDGNVGTLRVDPDGTVNCFSCGTASVAINGVSYRN